MSRNFHDEEIVDSGLKARLKRAHLFDSYGTLDYQKKCLVEEIISSFHDPSKWPVRDDERVNLLKSLYQKAVRIRETEAASAEAQ